MINQIILEQYGFALSPPALAGLRSEQWPSGGVYPAKRESPAALDEIFIELIIITNKIITKQLVIFYFISTIMYGATMCLYSKMRDIISEVQMIWKED